jgi:YegS/Rv2252/BmrU family lipid kinase
MARCLIIYNPVAAQGRAATRLPEVRQLLSSYEIDYQIILTEYAGHAVKLAERACEQDRPEVLVAAGGDGTCNEVINGMMLARANGCEPPPLAVLCVGRGNDFAYGAGLPVHLEEAVDSLAQGVPVPLDVGWLRGGLYPEGRYFGNGIGIGFDTIVGFEAAKLRWVKGFVAYVIGAFKTLLFYHRATEMTLSTAADTRTQPCLQVSIMNGRRMGGAFFMAPNSLSADGYFDLCIVGSPTRRKMVGLILKYMRGTQEGDPFVTTGRCRRMHVQSTEHGLAVHADGETISTDGLSLEAECIPSAIQVLRPAGAQG